MDYVQNPYFTDENVEKEKGIIGQEIKMYNDDSGFQIYIKTMESLYKENPVRLDIAGTIDSIAKITPDVLYKCYNTFYNLGNMVMVISGDFDPEDLIKEVEKRLKPQQDIGEIKRIYPNEQKEINKSRKEVKMEVSTPLFMIGFKDNYVLENKIGFENVGENIDIVKRHLAIEIILSLLIGKSSDLYKELYNNGDLLSEPELDYEFSSQYAHVLIGGQSKNPELVREKLNLEIQKLKKDGINDTNFERIKRKMYGDYIKEFNDVADISRMFLSDYFKGIWSFDYFEVYKDVNIEYVSNILNEVFDLEKEVITIIKK